MSDRRVRRAGAGSTASGERVTWVVAEGHRGRRWREIVTGPRGLRHSLLLETAPDGTFLHLELATPAGLLTLHPETDGTLHGNAVSTSGVRHIDGLPWDSAGMIMIEGSLVAIAAAASLAAGEGSGNLPAARTCLRVSAALDVNVEAGSLERLAAGTWRFAAGEPVVVDGDGLPVPGQASSWPLDVAR